MLVVVCVCLVMVIRGRDVLFDVCVLCWCVMCGVCCVCVVVSCFFYVFKDSRWLDVWFVCVCLFVEMVCCGVCVVSL